MANYKVLCKCFTTNYKLIQPKPPSDVKQVFDKYSGDGIYMMPDQLRRFLDDDEHGVSISDAECVIDRINHKRHHPALSLEDFHHFLFTTDLNPPIRSQVSSILLFIVSITSLLT